MSEWGKGQELTLFDLLGLKAHSGFSLSSRAGISQHSFRHDENFAV